MTFFFVSVCFPLGKSELKSSDVTMSQFVPINLSVLSSFNLNIFYSALLRNTRSLAK